MRTSILDKDEWGWMRGRRSPLPSKPFIQGLGPVCFDTRAAFTPSSFSELRSPLAHFLGGRIKYWDATAKPDNFIYEHFLEYEQTDNMRFFGFDKTLRDQRMNHLYFELHTPLYVKARFHGKTQADGKVFIHIYPSGFIVIHLALALKQGLIESPDALLKAVRETRPWRRDNQWEWTSRLGSGQLSTLAKAIKQRLCKSFFTNNTTNLRQGDWHSTLKLATNDEASTIANLFFKGKYEVFNLYTGYSEVMPGYENWRIYRSHLYDFPHSEKEARGDLSCRHKGHLISSTQGLIFLVPLHTQVPFGESTPLRREWSLRLFWMFFAYYEFILVKKQIYEDYAEYFRSEITDLKEYRLSTLRKVTQEPFRRLSVYDPKIRRYLAALDKHIRNTTPFHRRIYSSLSIGTNLNSNREKVGALLKEWEAEVEQWEPSLKMLWKKFLSPLQKLLSASN